MRSWVLAITSLMMATLICGCASQNRADPTWGLRESERAQERRAAPDGTLANVSLVFREAFFNDLLQAVDTLRQTRHVLFKSDETRYTLLIPPPAVEIMEGKTRLRTTIAVNVLGGTYHTDAVGDARIYLDGKENALYLEIGSLLVDIHAKVLGLRVNLDRVDVSTLYAPRIKLLDQLPVAHEFTVKKPKEGQNALKMQVAEHKIHYRPGEIVLDLWTTFQQVAQH